jgi:membrane protein
VGLHPLQSLRHLQQEARALLDDGQMAAREQTRLHPLQRFLHFWVLVGRSFVRNRCVVRATALSYTTLLSLVPLLAVGLGVATSFLKTEADKTEVMLEQLIAQVAPQLGLFPEEVVTQVYGPFLPGTEPAEGGAGDDDMTDAREHVVGTIMRFIGNINSGALGMTGTVALILVAVGLLGTIENTFNDIWGVVRGRNWFARIIQYWAAITLGPLILLFAMTFAVGAQVDAVQARLIGWLGPQFAVVGHLSFSLLANLLPWILVSTAFGLLYCLMPATQVDWKAAAVGGLVGGFLWWLNGKFNIVFAAKVVSVSKIYGPLGILPVFLLGLYFSWLILLFGAQVAYAYQNRRAYLQERLAETVNQNGREFVSLRLMSAIAGAFHRGERPPTLTELGEGLGVSSRLLAQLLEPLKRSRLVIEVNGPGPAFSPARPLDQIHCDEILEALRTGQGQTPATRDDAQRAAVEHTFREIRGAGRRVAQNRTLASLVRTDPGSGTPDDCRVEPPGEPR